VAGGTVDGQRLLVVAECFCGAVLLLEDPAEVDVDTGLAELVVELMV
jgi:hypothetical protein